MNERIPQTLVEAIRYFGDERAAWTCVVNRRWPDGIIRCPRCQSEKVRLVESRMIWNCRGCKRQFSVKIGTIFEESPLPFSKWLPAMWLIANAKNGISSCELARGLGVTQKTAWFMIHRIRLAFQNGTIEKLSGHAESDETFIGGLESNKHESRKLNAGRVVCDVVPNTKGPTLRSALFQTVDPGPNLYTDALRFVHAITRVVDRRVTYAELTGKDLVLA